MLSAAYAEHCFAMCCLYWCFEALIYAVSVDLINRNENGKNTIIIK
jgi:hypothetical protein